MAVKAIPEGYHAVTPFVISRDTARFLDFMEEAFGGPRTALRSASASG